MMTKRALFLGYIALGLLFFYLLVLQIAAIWPFTLDDMYISLRYARHWVDGYGIVWNIGEPPVEGYSNFLFVSIAALSLKLGLNPVIILKGLGIVGLMLSAVALYALSRFWFSKWLSLIPVLWLLVYRDEMVWVSSGLETTCYQALLLFSVVALLRGLGYRAFPSSRGKMVVKFWVSAGVLLALAGLTRPEGAVIGALFLGIAWFNLPKDQRFSMCFILATVVFSNLYGPYFLWRCYYFGSLLPNSVTCKGFAGLHWLVLDKAYLQLAWPLLLLGAVAVLSKIKQSDGVDRKLYFLWAPSVAYLVFLTQADPVSAMGQRLFLPAFIFLLPLALLGIQRVVIFFFNREMQASPVFITIGALWFGLLCLPISSLQQLVYFTENPRSGDALRIQLSDWLNTHIRSDDHIVLADSGMVPYLVPAHFEDSYCLNNKQMAKASYATMFDQFCEQTLHQRPAVIILSSLVEQGRIIYSPADHCLQKRLVRNQDYFREHVLREKTSDSGYQYEVFVRRS